MNFKAFGGTRLLSDSIFYGISNIFQKTFAILIVFFLSKNLTVENYGIIDFILTLISLCTILIIFGQDYAVARYFDQKFNKIRKQMIISQSLTIHLIQIIFFLPFMLMIIFFLKKKNIIPEENLNIIILTVLTIFSLVIINFCQVILRYSFERVKFILINFIQGLLFFLCIIYLIEYSNLNIEKILSFYFITNIFILFFSIFFIKNWLIFPKKKWINNKLIKYGFSFGLISLLTSLSMIYERYFIMEFVNTYYLGIYSLALKVGIIVQIAMNSILSGWEPYFLSNLKNENINRNLNLMLKITIYVGLFLALFFNLTGEYIILFLGDENYLEAKYYILPITLGVIFQELHRIPLSGIIESKKAHIFTTVQLMCFFILVLTLFLLKDLINLRIIVLVISFVYFFRFLSLSFIFNYVSKLKLNILDLILIFTIYTILFLIIYHFNVFNFNEFLKFIVMLTLSGASLTLFINLNEIKIIKKVMINFFR
jgi:O-antigen/teichoic acid export membrane protein